MQCKSHKIHNNNYNKTYQYVRINDENMQRIYYMWNIQWNSVL